MKTATAVVAKLAAKALPHILVSLDSQVLRDCQVLRDAWVFDLKGHSYSLPEHGEGTTFNRSIAVAYHFGGRLR
jgi:hypothetical protein